jgi:hypothetical protein
MVPMPQLFAISKYFEDFCCDLLFLECGEANIVRTQLYFFHNSVLFEGLAHLLLRCILVHAS